MPDGINIRSIRWSPSIVLASLASNLLALALPLVMLQLYDRVIPNQGHATLTVLAFGLGLAILTDAGLKLARGTLLAQAGADFERRSSARAIDTLLNSKTLEGTPPGVLYNQIAQIGRIRSFHTGDAGAALLDVPFIFVFLGVMMWISPVLGTTVLVLVAGVFCIVRSMRKQLNKLNDDRMERDGRRQSFLIETLTGFEFVKALGAEEFMERRYERLMSGSAPIGAAIASKVQLTQGITGAVGLLAPVVSASVGAYLVIDGQLTVGALAATVLLTGRIVQPALRIEALLIGDEDVRELETSLAPLLSPQYEDGKSVEVKSVDSLKLAWTPMRNEAEREDRGDGQVFKLVLRPGECISITGSESSGRSSLLAAIAGHRSLDQLDVSLNDGSIDTYCAHSLTKKIGLVTRNMPALSGTLLENLTRFEPSIYRARALELAAELGLDKFIARHPKGLDLALGDGARGELPAALSDLVHIISVLVTDPDVILFDQAESSLDHVSNVALHKLLHRLRSDKIIVLVSDRTQYRSLAQRHYRMDKGLLFPASGPVALSPDLFNRGVA